MDDNHAKHEALVLDRQTRLSALQEATKSPQLGSVIDRAREYYAFLMGADVPVRFDHSVTAVLNVVEPQPLADHPPIETQPEAAKRTRRTKAQIEADAAAEALKNAAPPVLDAVTVAAASTAAGPAPATEPAAPGDIVTMKAALMRVVETDGLGANAAMGIIKKQGGGATKVSVIEEKYYAAVEAACLEALAGVAK